FYGALEVKTIKIPFKTTQAEIPNISSVWALHDKTKELDFSGGFLSVIRGLVGMLFQNPPLSFTAKFKTIPPSK
ncbi:hypothetical protein, partial [Helicobacter pylori]|uniref:hypothetical protein n=1 Tax=Helicobacter pylori TaxID=210 RepID=UPI0039E128A4